MAKIYPDDYEIGCRKGSVTYPRQQMANSIQTSLAPRQRSGRGGTPSKPISATLEDWPSLPKTILVSAPSHVSGSGAVKISDSEVYNRAPFRLNAPFWCWAGSKNPERAWFGSIPRANLRLQRIIAVLANSAIPNVSFARKFPMGLADSFVAKNVSKDYLTDGQPVHAP